MSRLALLHVWWIFRSVLFMYSMSTMRLVWNTATVANRPYRKQEEVCVYIYIVWCGVAKEKKEQRLYTVGVKRIVQGISFLDRKKNPAWWNNLDRFQPRLEDLRLVLWGLLLYTTHFSIVVFSIEHSIRFYIFIFPLCVFLSSYFWNSIFFSCYLACILYSITYNMTLM